MFGLKNYTSPARSLTASEQSDLRDEFAKAAMQAMLSAYPCQALDRDDGGINADKDALADEAYDIADAMLRARETE